MTAARIKDTLKKHALPPLSIFSRATGLSGLALFSTQAGVKYLMGASSVGGNLIITASVAGTFVSAILSKTAATYMQFDPRLNPEIAAVIARQYDQLHLTGKITFKLFTFSGVGYGLMNSFSTHFCIVNLCETIANLFNASSNNSLWKILIVQSLSLSIAGMSYLSYYSFDSKLVARNSLIIAKNTKALSWNSFDRYFFKTIASSALNIPAYTMMAAFFAESSLNALPYLAAIIKNVGIKILTSVACTATAMTVISWLPSVYKQFAPQMEEQLQQHANVPNTFIAVSLKILSYLSGILDALGANGLGTFISVIFTMNHFFNTDPYSWGLIITALVFGLDTAFMDFMFTILSGLQELMDWIYKDVGGEMVPLAAVAANNYGTQAAQSLPVDGEERAFFSEDATRQGITLFGQAQASSNENPRTRLRMSA